VNDGFCCSVVEDAGEVRGSAGAGKFSSGTLPMLLLPYAGVENVRWFCGVTLGVLVLLKDG
jgi:hypothetical protein